MTNNQKYSITDMVDGKVTRIKLGTYKFNLFKPTDTDELSKICNSFLSTVDFSTPITEEEIVEVQQTTSLKEIAKSIPEKIPLAKVLGHVLGTGKNSKIKVFSNPVSDMKQKFELDLFDAKQMERIMKEYYPKHTPRSLYSYTKANITFLIDRGDLEVIGTGRSKQYKFIKLQLPEFDSAEMKERSLKERDALQGTLR